MEGRFERNLEVSSFGQPAWACGWSSIESDGGAVIVTGPRFLHPVLVICRMLKDDHVRHRLALHTRTWLAEFGAFPCKLMPLIASYPKDRCVALSFLPAMSFENDMGRPFRLRRLLLAGRPAG